MLANYFDQIVAVVITSFATAIAWFVRVTLTNQKQIALLQNEIRDRDKRRDEDRQFMHDFKQDVKSSMGEVKKDIAEVKSEILEIYKTKQ